MDSCVSSLAIAKLNDTNISVLSYADLLFSILIDSLVSDDDGTHIGRHIMRSNLNVPGDEFLARGLQIGLVFRILGELSVVQLNWMCTGGCRGYVMNCK